METLKTSIRVIGFIPSCLALLSLALIGDYRTYLLIVSVIVLLVCILYAEFILMVNASELLAFLGRGSDPYAVHAASRIVHRSIVRTRAEVLALYLLSLIVHIFVVYDTLNLWSIYVR